MKRLSKSLACIALTVIPLSATSTLRADSGPSWSGSTPAPGVYFSRYEPSFYAGFAPRTQDRARVHLELGRGNQQRLTIVLGAYELDSYLEGLLARRDTIQEMIDKGVIELTTNREFERFAGTLVEAGVEATVYGGDLGPEAYRGRTLDIMSKLNPGRVFRIAIPVDRIVADWYAYLAVMRDVGLGSAEAKLDAANAVLPGRVNLHALNGDIGTALGAAFELVRVGNPADDPAFREQTVKFLELVTKGRYPVVDGQVRAVEFTAAYPAGTINAWTEYKGSKLPDFGATGIWPLIPHEHGKGPVGMVDYLSPNPGYGFIPLLGYQHLGGIAYHSLHNAGVRFRLDANPLLPKEWRDVRGERNPEQNYQHLWLGSRGPSSRGSTRLPSGHMSELRDALPSTSEGLAGIPNFRNKPECYDVFDVDGDGAAEVMGVRYYLAFGATKHVPEASYAPNERKGFYQWLYQDNISYREDGSAIIKEAPVCRFSGLKKAEAAWVLQDVPLFEAPYARESIQFYRTKPVDFRSKAGFELNRELRRIGADYEPDRGLLLLD